MTKFQILNYMKPKLIRISIILYKISRMKTMSANY